MFVGLFAAQSRANASKPIINTKRCLTKRQNITFQHDWWSTPFRLNFNKYPAGSTVGDFQAQLQLTQVASIEQVIDNLLIFMFSRINFLKWWKRVDADLNSVRKAKSWLQLRWKKIKTVEWGRFWGYVTGNVWWWQFLMSALIFDGVESF